VAEEAGVTTGDDELAVTEAEGVAAGDGELADPVPVAVFGVAVGLARVVGLGVLAERDVSGGEVAGAGPGEAETGVVAGVTPTVAAGGGLTRR
jgi:hypothetical protein